MLPIMPAVTVERFGVCCPEGASMSDDYQLHLTLVDVDQHCGAPLCVHEEDDGEDRHLKLRAGPDEGAPNGLHQTVPAELEVQNVVILIRLRTENTQDNINNKTATTQQARRETFAADDATRTRW